MQKLFNLKTIEASLKAFQRVFPRINDQLAIRREDLTDSMILQIVDAYDFLNSLLKKEMDLFTPAGLHALLEMNHIVLCGTDKETRAQYYFHLEETRKSFLGQIRSIKDWVLRKRKESDPYHLATGFYSRMLSRPQLFLEGNHRTGNVILNYLLISKNSAPYIVTEDNARDYFDISGDIKFTENDNYIDTALRMPGHRSRFRSFLRLQVRDEYLLYSE